MMPPSGHLSDLSLTRIAWPPLIAGRLIRRYKRFLADVRLDTGATVTAHCPNSGRMIGCAEPGRPVYLSFHDSPRRKLKYTWEMIDMPASLVGVNTLVPNRLVALAAGAALLPEFHGYATVQTEVAVALHTRLDLCLTDTQGRNVFVEVKNCTLVEDGKALFPDAVTARGRKHLEALAELHRAGHRAVIFYVVQRMDAERFSPADRIDPAYGQALRRALDQGVEALVYDTMLDLGGIALNRRLPLAL
ncbi:MAG: DNA/RNA nuclease SfsA [Desulfobacterales bacterium]